MWNNGEHELVVVSHPSASWMLTFTRFAAPRSSEPHKDRENERGITNSLQITLKMRNSLINVFSPCTFSNTLFPAGRVDRYTFIPVNALEQFIPSNNNNTNGGQGEVTR